MQLPMPPNAQKIVAIEAAIQTERLNRYMAAAENHKEQAVRLYLWNCLLCESFHISLHFAEITCRNAIQRGLKAKFGNNWFEHKTLINLMDEQHKNEIYNVAKKERKQHGSVITAHHIVSALSFGFWQHLATKRFDRILWGQGIRVYFPNAPEGQKREDLYKLMEKVRRWRNRIAHHEAIFDKGPASTHYDAINLIKWVCPETADYVASISKVPLALSLRPKL